MFGSTNFPGAYQSLGFGATNDAIYLPVIFGGTGDLKLTTSYGVRGAYNHNWDPYWSTSVFGSASWVTFGGNQFDITSAKGQFCFAYGLATGAKSVDYSCNPNFAVYQAGVVTRWTPVKNLTFSAEVMWTGLDQNFTGAAVQNSASIAPKPVGVFYQFKDQDTVTMNVCVQRNF
jgi:hypothetical protein